MPVFCKGFIADDGVRCKIGLARCLLIWPTRENMKQVLKYR